MRIGEKSVQSSWTIDTDIVILILQAKFSKNSSNVDK